LCVCAYVCWGWVERVKADGMAVRFVSRFVHEERQRARAREREREREK